MDDVAVADGALTADWRAADALMDGDVEGRTAPVASASGPALHAPTHAINRNVTRTRWNTTLRRLGEGFVSSSLGDQGNSGSQRYRIGSVANGVALIPLRPRVQIRVTRSGTHQRRK